MPIVGIHKRSFKPSETSARRSTPYQKLATNSPIEKKNPSPALHSPSNISSAIPSSNLRSIHQSSTSVSSPSKYKSDAPFSSISNLHVLQKEHSPSSFPAKPLRFGKGITFHKARQTHGCLLTRVLDVEHRCKRWDLEDHAWKATQAWQARIVDADLMMKNESIMDRAGDGKSTEALFLLRLFAMRPAGLLFHAYVIWDG